MSKTRRDVLARGLALLAECFNEPLSELRVELYLHALHDLSDADLEAAVSEAMRRCRFFPKPVELRELVVGSPHEAAEMAWGQLMDEVHRVGYYGTPVLPEGILIAVRRCFGGWQAFCEHYPAGDEALWWQKRFLQAYETQEKHVALGLPTSISELPERLQAMLRAMPALPPGEQP